MLWVSQVGTTLLAVISPGGKDRTSTYISNVALTETDSDQHVASTLHVQIFSVKTTMHWYFVIIGGLVCEMPQPIPHPWYWNTTKKQQPWAVCLILGMSYNYIGCYSVCLFFCLSWRRKYATLFESVTYGGYPPKQIIYHKILSHLSSNCWTRTKYTHIVSGNGSDVFSMPYAKGNEWSNVLNIDRPQIYYEFIIKMNFSYSYSYSSY